MLRVAGEGEGAKGAACPRPGDEGQPARIGALCSVAHLARRVRPTVSQIASINLFAFWGAGQQPLKTAGGNEERACEKGVAGAGERTSAAESP